MEDRVRRSRRLRPVLTRTTESTGAGLALPALTDTVMAAVPERDAGVGSAVNDVSRQLGGALGVAVIGSFVSSGYRAKLHHLLGGTLPAPVARSAAGSIGMARQTARTLPANEAATLTRAADHAFVVAATMVPRRMRTAQFGDGPADAIERDEEEKACSTGR